MIIDSLTNEHLIVSKANIKKTITLLHNFKKQWHLFKLVLDTVFLIIQF